MAFAVLLRYASALLAAGSCLAAVQVEGAVYFREGRNRRPLSGAFITARSLEQSEVLATSRTDASGRYQLINLLPGRFAVKAFRPGYYPRESGGRAASQTLDCSSGCAYLDLDFELTRGAVVTGLVVDDLGEPVEQAQVSLQPAGRPAPAKSIIVHQAATDDRGLFRLAGLAAGVYTLRAVSRRGGSVFEAVPVEIGLGEGEQPAAIRLTLRTPSAFGVSGTVLGVDAVPGEPTGIRLEGLSTTRQNFNATVDQNNHFHFQGVNEGKYLAIAIPGAAGYRPGTDQFLDVVDVRGDVAGLVLRPSPRGSVTGRVKPASGLETSRIGLRFSSNEGLGTRGVEVRAPNFEFRVADLVPGSYGIEASEGFYVKEISRSNAIIPAGDVTVSPGVATLEIVIAACTGSPGEKARGCPDAR